MKITKACLIALLIPLFLSGCAEPKAKNDPVSKVLATNKDHHFVVVNPANDKPFEEGDRVVVTREGKIMAKGQVASSDLTGSIVKLSSTSSEAEFPKVGDSVHRE
ncbi:MAG: hypothetical protein HC904_13700 [Blastochloris sp.]|nr:hypothetical protein [Blastochloris sp.]